MLFYQNAKDYFLKYNLLVYQLWSVTSSIFYVAYFFVYDYFGDWKKNEVHDFVLEKV